MLNYYKVLEIPDFSDEKQIKSAYRKLSKKYHPDRNADPAAHEYFIKITEAYDFLNDENKRFLLDQYLLTVAHRTTHQTVDFSKDAQKVNPPVVHYFYCNKAFYTLPDEIQIHWNVSYCKEVRVSLFGQVESSGVRCFTIDKFYENLKVVLFITGLDDKVYTSEIILSYQESNPYKEAFHRVLNKYPHAEKIHFKKENFFESSGRLGREEFKFRLVLLSVSLVITATYNNYVNAEFFMIVVFFTLLLLIYVQLKKRVRDCKSIKHFSKKIFLPLWNFTFIKRLFFEESEPESNEYGMPPQEFSLDLRKIFPLSQAKNSFALLKFGSGFSFIWLLITILINANAKYDEYSIKLTGIYSAPNSYSYDMNFESDISFELFGEEYNELYHNKDHYSYKVGLNKHSEIKYIKAYDIKNEEVLTYRFGGYENLSPIFVLIGLLFIAHLFATTSLKKPEEIYYAKGILFFILLLNFFLIVQM